MHQVGQSCEHCGVIHAGPCPRIKAIEYHETGTIKRIEYWENHEHISAALDRAVSRRNR